MNNNTQKVVLGVVAVLLVVFGVAYLKQTTVIVQTPETQPQSFGAFPGDTLNSYSFNQNGLVTDAVSKSFQYGTSTICVIPKPQATSTLVMFTALPVAATTSAVTLVLEDRTVGYPPPLTSATSTTVFNTVQLQAASSLNVFATSTAIDTAAGNSRVTGMLKGGGFLVYYAKYASDGASVTETSGTVFPSGGRCKALFREI